MRTALDAPDSALDPGDRGFVAKIRKHGWATTSIAGEEGHPEFCYTTGFWLTFGHPELLLFGLEPGTAHQLFSELAMQCRRGEILQLGRQSSVFENIDAFVQPVAKSHYPEHLGFSRWFYGNDDFECLQIFWPDMNGFFPWEPGADPLLGEAQPSLDP